MPVFLRRLRLRNYRSVATCDLEFKALTFLVGPNGAGKSNLIDALRLVADALNGPLDHALRDRGGINDVRRRSSGHPNNFSLRLDFDLSSGESGSFALEVHAVGQGGYRIKRERCELHRLLEPSVAYDVQLGVLAKTTLTSPPAVGGGDRLYLTNLSGTAELRPVYDALASMGFYNPVVAMLREVQAPDPGRLLGREGHNLASVLGRLQDEAPERMERLVGHLRQIVPGIEGVRRTSFANKETIEFRQQVQGATAPWRFFANSMSDGTLRALAILVALFQHGGRGAGSPVPLVAVEEPEAGLHPHATAVLLAALLEASEHTQVIVTSHSPDLLDDKRLTDDQIIAVESQHGTTLASPIDPGARDAVRSQLYTIGELLRDHQLRRDVSQAPPDPRQMDLFGT